MKYCQMTVNIVQMGEESRSVTGEVQVSWHSL